MSNTLQEKLATLSPEARAALLKKAAKLKQASQAKPTLADEGASAASKATPSEKKLHTDVAPSTIIPDPQAMHVPFPLTDIQQAYFIGRQSAFELGNVSARGYTEIRCQHLDVPRLIAAWNATIARHAMLRAIVRPDGQQVIQDAVPSFAILERDLRALDAPAQQAELRAVRDDMSHRVLPADQWPLFEMEVSHLSDTDSLLHIGIDVLIFDAWSYDILNWELEQRYKNPDIQLPALSLTFRDYVLALKAAEANTQPSADTSAQQNAAREEYAEAKAYWEKRIDVLPGPPELPLATDPKLITNPRFDRLNSRIDAADWTRFKQLAGQAGVTPSVALLTIYTDVLSAWSKNPHFSLNLTLFNRLALHEQVNDIIGDFTNLVIVEVGKTKGLSFKQRAKAIQTQLWEDMDHRAFSGVSVLRELSKKWGRINEPVMPVVFTSAVGHAMPDSQGAHFTWLGEEAFTITQTPQVWLDHQVFEDRGDLVFDWDFVQHLFPPAMLQHMFSAYCAQLQQLIADAKHWDAFVEGQHSGYLPADMLAQRHQAHDDSHGYRDIGQHQLLHTGFVAQAFANPHASAIIDANHAQPITYAHLYRSAHAIYRQLRAADLSLSELVGVSANKDWTQVAAVMGISMAGGAYLPLDPELPEQRLAYILQKSACRFVLDAHPSEAKAYPESIQILDIATQDGPELNEPELNGAKLNESELNASESNASELNESSELPPAPPALACPTDLAYVIFTSGSTGQPKGVMIDHRGAMNTICDINQRFRVTQDDRVLALSALSFDLSVYDVFGVLGAGGALVMPHLNDLRDPLHWAQLMRTHRVSIWNTAPALMEMLTSALEGSQQPVPESLRFILMSGDWIPVTLPKRINTISRHRISINSLGGATEGSIWSIIYPIDTDWANSEAGERASIPYGKGLTNQDVQVLDRNFRQKPDWVPGDLYITGQGVALGYLGDEARTQAAFIIDPHSGERIYRTGDLGRYLPDGNIEFLGREDFQVKVHGFRIELGEIESLLAQHADVQNVVVDVIGKPQNRRLAAYVVLDPRDATQPMPGYALLSDGAARMQFRLDKPGIRRFNEQTNPAIHLLPAQDDTREALIAAMRQRKTMRCFTQAQVSFDAFAGMLQHLATAEALQAPQKTTGGLPKYRYGSSGSLYPVRTYLYIPAGRVENVAGGTYYFNPETCELHPLSDAVTFPESIHAPANRASFNDAAFSVYFVAKLAAIAPLYGDHSRHFCDLEAGLMTQVLEEAAPALGLGICQIGDMHYAPIREYFQLDEDEVFLHSVFGGVPDHEANQHFYDAAPSDHAVITAGLSRYLSAYLPEYMVPGDYMLLDELPITSNGKVDRKALPSIDEQPHHSKQQFVAPSSQLEQRIADIWREVLGVERLSIHDNFFDIGGNSVHMTQIYSQLQADLPTAINMIDMFFRYPSIHALVEFFAQSMDDGAHNTSDAFASNARQQQDDAEQEKIAQRRQARRHRRGR